MQTTPYTHAQQVEAFWSKVNKDGPTQSHMDTPCWEWTGGCTTTGYGRCCYAGRFRSATHVSVALAAGFLLPLQGMVCHRCDNPSCVNPEHLFLGTHQDNMDDRSRKGRTRVAQGEANGQSKLTASQLHDARERYAQGNITQRELAGEFGVSQGTLSVALRGKTWASADSAPVQGRRTWKLPARQRGMQ